MSGLIKGYIEQLFDDKKVSEENRQKLWKFYYDKLSKAVDIGFSPKSSFWDEPLANALKTNIAEFSAFKETSFRKTLEDLLTTDGKLTPKAEFLKEAYKVSGDYNTRWLQTEYHQTIANAQSAEKWKSFEDAKDLYPNLKLTTVRDARVRPEHKVLDGIIRPIDDPFWDTHMTPLDWGCRCDVEQTDEEPNEIKGGVQLKMEFENNPAKTGKIFNGSGYITSGGLNPQQIEKIAAWGRSMLTKVKDVARKKYEKIVLSKPRKEQFKQIFESKNGKVLQHLLYKKGGDHKDIIDVAKNFTRISKIVEILPEINRKGFENFREIVFPNYLLKKNPDFRIDGVYYDLKIVETFAEFTRNANRAYKQDAIAILKFDGDLTDEKMIQIKKRIYGDNNRNHKNGKPFYGKDHFYIFNKGNLYKYNRD